MIMMYHRDAVWQENLATQTFDGSYYLCALHTILPVVLFIILMVMSVSVLWGSAVEVCGVSFSPMEWNEMEVHVWSSKRKRWTFGKNSTATS